MKMITAGLVMVLLLGTTGQVAPETVTYLYTSLDEDTGEPVGQSSRTLRRLSETTLEVSIAWSSLTDSTSGHQRYVVDEHYSTLEWTVQQPDEGTDYTGVRTGNLLTLKGTLKGEALDKRIEIDDKPFYNNPAFGLQGLVRSGKEKIEFRTLRPGNLDEYKMKAEVQERTKITIQGEEVAAVRVKWGLTGFKSYFFKQNLWFRATDGVFLRAQPREGQYAELTGEHPGD